MTEWRHFLFDTFWVSIFPEILCVPLFFFFPPPFKEVPWVSWAAASLSLPFFSCPLSCPIPCLVSLFQESISFLCSFYPFLTLPTSHWRRAGTGLRLTAPPELNRRDSELREFFVSMVSAFIQTHRFGRLFFFSDFPAPRRLSFCSRSSGPMLLSAFPHP